MPRLVEIGPVALEKRMKLWNIYIWQTIRKIHFSFQLSTANKKKVNWMLFCYILQKYIFFLKIIHDEYIYINSSISCGNHMRLISSVGIIFSVGLFISVELIFFKGHIFNITQYFINVNIFCISLIHVPMVFKYIV